MVSVDCKLFALVVLLSHTNGLVVNLMNRYFCGSMTTRRRPISVLFIKPTIYARDTQYQRWETHHVRLNMTTRRDMLAYIAVSIISGETLTPISSNTNIENIKPYAPLEALLPATRVRVFINESVKIAQQLVRYQEEKNQDSDTWIAPIQRLDYIFAHASENIGLDSLQPETKLSSYYSRAYLDELKSLPVTDVPLAVLTQVGNYRQYALLQNRQKKLEKENSLRAAFNLYTRQLRFDADRYVWTASLQERKKFIRQYDALPNVSTVITSDLDLRDLIRNQILDAWDDARGEFYFQITESLKLSLPFSLEKVQRDWTSGDWTELEMLLLRLQTFCNEWFALIPDQDQADALEVVLREGILDKDSTKLNH